MAGPAAILRADPRPPLATGADLKQDRPMHPIPALARMTRAALCGRMPVAGLNNNNRNNASLPRAGD
jgi:hypothetical protein